MKVYIVKASSGTHQYIVGVYADEVRATAAARREEEFRGGKYICGVDGFEVIDSVSNDDGMDLQQQVEALQAYVNVLQGYTLVLKDAMMMVLEVPAIRAKVGEKTTELLRRDLSKGSRTTWDDEMRKYIRER
jgi:hypothetical protein